MTSAEPPLIDIQGVSRSYGTVRALRDVSIRVAPGAVGLVGNNGAGKSTLLKVLLGLLAPDTGRGTILGRDILRPSRDLRGDIGYMPETAAIVPGLKGVEFAALSGDLYGMPRVDARRRAHETLDYVGLDELRYRPLEEYSLGNLQRLKLAAALIHDPKLLLLDEPTNGLDPAGRIAMLRTIEDLIAETGKSVLLCSHLLGDVERLCKQVVVLHRGTVLHAGPLENLRQTSQCYALAWTGDGERYVAALRAAGLETTHEPGTTAALAGAPSDWSAPRFFALAKLHGVTLTLLKRDEENLERLFFRITGSAAPGPDASPPGMADVA